MGAVAVAVAMLAGRDAASASTVGVVPDPDAPRREKLVFVAAAGERNEVAISVDDATGSRIVTVTDSGATLTALAPCVAVDAHTAQCTNAPGHSFSHQGFEVELGDGDDLLRVVSGRTWDGRPADYLAALTADGGPGDDRLYGGGSDDRLDGGGGRDELYGGYGSDELTDGDHDGASETARPGADLLVGGNRVFDTDVVSYTQRRRPVSVDLTRKRGGARGENDVLREFEDITGGRGDDRLAGDGHPNAIDGGPGADRLLGRGGFDRISIGKGDSVYCGPNGEVDGEEQVDSVWPPTTFRMPRKEAARVLALASTYLDPSCESITVDGLGRRNRPEDDEYFSFPAAPSGRSASSLTFAVFAEASEEPGPGRITWREAAGRHRLLAVAPIKADRPRSKPLRVQLTPLGRLLARRRHGVRATTRFRGTKLIPPINWTTRLRIPSP